MKIGLFTILYFIILLFPSILLSQNADSIAGFRYFNKVSEFRSITKFEELTQDQVKDSIYKYAVMSVPFLKRGKFWDEYARISTIISNYIFEDNALDGISYLEKIADTLQQNKSAARLELIYIKLSTWCQKNAPGRSLSFLNKAYETATEKKNIKLSANILKLIGNQYLLSGKLDTALVFYKKALSLRKKTNATQDAMFNMISVGYKISGNSDLALKYMDSAIIASDYSYLKKSKYLNDKGAIYITMGDYEKALEYCEDGIKLQLKMMSSDFVSLFYNYVNLAIILNNKGDFIRSNEYLDEAFSLLKKEHKLIKSSPFPIYSLKIQNYLDMNDNETAFQHVKKLFLYLKQSKKDTSLAFPYFGQVYYQMGNYDSSLAFYKMISNPEQFYNSIAQVYLRLKDYSESRYYYKRYLKTLTKYHLINDHPIWVIAFKEIGDSYFFEEKYDSAYYYYSLALQTTGIKFENTDLQIIDIISKKDLEITVYELFWQLSKIHQLYYQNSGNQEELRRSHRGFLIAAELLNKFKLNLQSEKSKLFWSEQTANFYDEALNNTFLIYNKTSENSFLEDAFRLIELSKVHVLKGSINEFAAKKIADISDSLLAIENNFSHKLNSLRISKRKELANRNADQIKINYFDNEIFRTQRDYTFLIKEFEEHFPDYFRIKYETNTITLKDVQKQLDSDQVLLQYYLGKNHLYVFIISSEKVDVYTSPSDSGFSNEIYNFVALLSKGNLLRNKQRTEFFKQSVSLCNKLFEPLREYFHNKNELIIIPSNELLSLPFEVLIRDTSLNLSFKDQNYLIKDFNISYEYSATLGFDPRYRKHVSSDDCFIGFAPSFKNSRDGFSDLPYNVDEVKKIYELFKSRNKTARIFTGIEASEKNLKEIAFCKYIHIATHSKADENNHNLSALYFSGPQPDSLYDNILYSDEVFNLKLSADLVVLSSCETGVGKIINGEGILALTRGFIYNGIPNLLFSLWEVSDRSTYSLMIEFYKNILKGEEYKTALRHSKLKMLQNEFTSFPDKWGSFTLIGR